MILNKFYTPVDGVFYFLFDTPIKNKIKTVLTTQLYYGNLHTLHQNDELLGYRVTLPTSIKNNVNNTYIMSNKGKINHENLKVENLLVQHNIVITLIGDNLQSIIVVNHVIEDIMSL